MGPPSFWGTCGIPKTPKFKTGNEALLYSIKCGNANDILSYRIINVAYQGYTVTQIVQAIFDQYVSAEGITLGEISQTDVTIDVYTAKDMNLQDALNELADLVGAIWRIDENRKFYFIGEEDFPVFPRKSNQTFCRAPNCNRPPKTISSAQCSIFLALLKPPAPKPNVLFWQKTKTPLF